MKKFVPVIILIIAFSGFLSTQILWDTFNLNAEQVGQDKQKYAAYEASFQTLKITTTDKSTIEIRQIPEPIVLLNFWASWCVPCLKEFPSLVKFQEKYQGQVKVLGINGDDQTPEENIQKISQKYRLNFPSTSDSRSLISNQFMINTYPVSIIFHRGEVIYVNNKIHDFMNPDFLALIDKALATKVK